MCTGNNAEEIITVSREEQSPEYVAGQAALVRNGKGHVSWERYPCACAGPWVRGEILWWKCKERAQWAE